MSVIERTQHDRLLRDQPQAAVLCTHCALDVPPGLIDPSSDEQFCCQGCRAAHSVINSCGLQAYYSLLASSGDHAPTASAASRAFEAYDDPTFTSLYTREVEGNQREVQFALDGVHCGACLWLIEKLPVMVKGVTQARLHIRAGLVTIVLDPAIVKVSAIAAALATLGYTPHPAKERSIRDQRTREDRKLLISIAVAGACAGNVMMLAFALYGGFFDGMSTPYQWLFRGLSAALGALSLSWPGAVFFRSALASIRTRTPNIDVPIVLALLAGGIAGIVNTILARGDLYFDSLTMLVLLLLFGRFVSHKHQRWASDSVELLYSITPFSARRINPDASVTDVPAEALAIGDTVEVRGNESIPVDGVVVSGRSQIDLSLLSGESRGIHVAEGSDVLAGAINLASPLHIRATATGRDTRAGRLMQLVGDAAARRARIIRFTDAIAGRFILVVTLLAAITFLWWLPRSTSSAIDNAIALLIVTCPCALGIAAPVAVGLAIGRASKDGVLIKGGDALETLATPGTIILDKTGTLTEGKPRVVNLIGDPAALALAAALEAGVSHPVAAAICDAAPNAAMNAANIRHEAGVGVHGTVEDQDVFVGSESAALALAQSSTVSPADFESLRAQGLSPVAIVVGGTLTTAIGIGDRLRPEAKRSIAALRAKGWSIEILSGDHDAVVKAVGASLDIPPQSCHGGATPEAKLAYINKKRLGAGTVVMIGDGVNDAAALAAASVGIAVQGGAEASLAAADIYISRSGLSPILQLIDAGPRTLRTIHTILAVSLVYNIIAGALAMTGTIHPMIAAAMMPLSSLSVLTVAVRSRAWRTLAKSNPTLSAQAKIQRANGEPVQREPLRSIPCP